MNLNDLHLKKPQRASDQDGVHKNNGIILIGIVMIWFIWWSLMKSQEWQNYDSCIGLLTLDVDHSLPDILSFHLDVNY